MRSVVLSMIISLDGFIAGPERELDWMIGPDPEREAEHLQFLEHVDTATSRQLRARTSCSTAVSGWRRA
jgi:hypothetical protein